MINNPQTERWLFWSTLCWSGWLITVYILSNGCSYDEELIVFTNWLSIVLFDHDRYDRWVSHRPRVDCVDQLTVDCIKWSWSIWSTGVTWVLLRSRVDCVFLNHCLSVIVCPHLVRRKPVDRIDHDQSTHSVQLLLWITPCHDQLSWSTAIKWDWIIFPFQRGI